MAKVRAAKAVRMTMMQDGNDDGDVAHVPLRK